MIRPKSKKQRGFTLLEVIVGMVLFSFTALGLTSLILQNQFQAQASLRQQAATTFALGVIENLVARSNNQLISGSVSITLHDGTDLTLDDDVWASSTFELMGTPGKPQDDMPIDLKLTITDELDSDVNPQIIIELEYRWPRKTVGGGSETDKGKWLSHELMIIRSNIRSYSE